MTSEDVTPERPFFSKTKTTVGIHVLHAPCYSLTLKNVPNVQRKVKEFNNVPLGLSWEKYKEWYLSKMGR